MSKFDKEFKELREQEEALLVEVYNDKLKHLEDELSVRFGLSDNKGFKKIEPEWEYENTPEYIEHQKNNLQIGIKEEKIKIMVALNNIKRKDLERQEIESLKEAK